MVHGGWWRAVFAGVVISQAVISVAVTWILCTNAATKGEVLACATFTQDVPLSAFLATLIAATAVSGVLDSVALVVSVTLATLTPFVAEMIVCVTVGCMWGG